MSISKKIVVSLSFLAIIGGISIAIISVSANGKLFDTQAVAFIQNGDLSGYKTYLINEQTNRINSIDQAKFDKIRAKYEAAKPLMDLQAKYEPELKILASDKNETGFLVLFKQYREEVKSIMDQNKTGYDSGQVVDLSKHNGKKMKMDRFMNTELTEDQKSQMAQNEYRRALRDLEAGRDYNLGRNFEGRGYEMMKGEFNDKNSQDSDIENIDN